MIRDPNYFLEKAKRFYKIANDGEYIDNDIDGDDTDIDIDTDERVIVPEVKRFYDPVTRHYYRTERRLGDSAYVSDCGDVPLRPFTNVWYPENRLSKQIIYDANTHTHKKVTKVYDSDGNYSLLYTNVAYKPIKKPGYNNYIPHYIN